jgi:2',3'-cyclic-nucleotide 2'-phosphodiesterase (5'-nucleotidase family)
VPRPAPNALDSTYGSRRGVPGAFPAGSCSRLASRGTLTSLFACLALVNLLVLGGLEGCGSRGAVSQTKPAVEAEAAIDSAPGSWVTLLHTNDIHGAYQARPAAWLEGNPLNGGFRALAGAVATLRAEGPILLVDDGDLMAGTPLTTVERHGVPGGGAMEFMNALGYDAMALGNHELDLGQEACLGLLEMAEFPVLCANLVDRETGDLFAPAAHLLVERAGIKVAFFGLILDDLAEVVAAGPLRGLDVRPVVETARAEVERLDPESDLLIALTHQGLEPSRELARQVPGIDVIVAGHDHRRTEEPIVESGVLIVETGSSLEHLGRLDLKVAGDRVVDHRFQLLDLPASAMAEAPAAVDELHDEIDGVIQAEYGQVVGELVEPLVRDSSGESNIGNWVTDAMREAAGADFAVTNSSGIRADVEAGPLTRLEIQAIAPFPNVLSTFRASGEELLVFARMNARKSLGLERRGRSIVQVSGIAYSYGPDGEIHELMVGGEQVEPGGSYLGATNDYVLFSQAEKYLGFVPAETERTSQIIFDVLCEAATRTTPIAARVEGRIRAETEAPAGASVSTGEAGGW